MRTTQRAAALQRTVEAGVQCRQLRGLDGEGEVEVAVGAAVDADAIGPAGQVERARRQRVAAQRDAPRRGDRVAAQAAREALDRDVQRHRGVAAEPAVEPQAAVEPARPVGREKAGIDAVDSQRQVGADAVGPGQRAVGLDTAVTDTERQRLQPQTGRVALRLQRQRHLRQVGQRQRRAQRQAVVVGRAAQREAAGSGAVLCRSVQRPVQLRPADIDAERRRDLVEHRVGTRPQLERCLDRGHEFWPQGLAGQGHARAHFADVRPGQRRRQRRAQAAIERVRCGRGQAQRTVELRARHAQLQPVDADRGAVQQRGQPEVVEHEVAVGLL